MAVEKTMAAAKTDPSPGYEVDDADESKMKKMMMMIEGEGSESVDDDDEYVDVWVLRTVREGPVKVSRKIKNSSGKELDPKMREEFFAQLDEKAMEYRPMVLHSHEEAQAICEAANKELSELAVELHNAGLTHGEGPELDLVVPLDSNPFMFNTFHYHMNFIAKPKDGSDDEKKCYFAEVKGTHGGDELLTICCPVEAKEFTLKFSMPGLAALRAAAPNIMDQLGFGDDCIAAVRRSSLCWPHLVECLAVV